MEKGGRGVKQKGKKGIVKEHEQMNEIWNKGEQEQRRKKEIKKGKRLMERNGKEGTRIKKEYNTYKNEKDWEIGNKKREGKRIQKKCQ